MYVNSTSERGRRLDPTLDRHNTSPGDEISVVKERVGEVNR